MLLLYIMNCISDNLPLKCEQTQFQATITVGSQLHIYKDVFIHILAKVHTYGDYRGRSQKWKEFLWTFNTFLL